MKTCSIEGCDGKYEGLGYCKKHYGRFKKHGDPLKTLRAANGEHKGCKVEGCEGKHRGLGYCKEHYGRFKKHGDPLKTLTAVKGEHEGCKVEGCEGKHNSLGYCKKHYVRFKKHGDPGQAENLKAAKGSGFLTKGGYRKITVDGKNIFQHRHVMQLHLVRELFEGENVHHINGVRDDNRLENLELWNTSQPAGQRVEDKIKFYIEFLVQYGYEVNKL